MEKVITNVGKTFGQRLSEARGRKGLSQRQLAKRIGIQQAHLSKIEQGKIDTRLSSLVEIARALDLDVQLVPRQALSAVEGAVKAVEGEQGEASESRVLATLSRQERDIERIREVFPNLDAAGQLQRTINEIKYRPLDSDTIKALQRAMPSVQRVTQGLALGLNSEELKALIVKSHKSLKQIRNAQFHGILPPAGTADPQPAYRLDDEEDDDDA